MASNSFCLCSCCTTFWWYDHAPSAITRIFVWPRWPLWQDKVTWRMKEFLFMNTADYVKFLLFFIFCSVRNRRNWMRRFASLYENKGVVNLCFPVNDIVPTSKKVFLGDKYIGLFFRPRIHKEQILVVVTYGDIVMPITPVVRVIHISLTIPCLKQDNRRKANIDACF